MTTDLDTLLIALHVELTDWIIPAGLWARGTEGALGLSDPPDAGGQPFAVPRRGRIVRPVVRGAL